MKRAMVFAAVCALSACQPGAFPVVVKSVQGKASNTTGSGPMRPSGTAFDLAAANVTDFETCVGIGIIVPASMPIECVHDGVTYTDK